MRIVAMENSTFFYILASNIGLKDLNWSWLQQVEDLENGPHQPATLVEESSKWQRNYSEFEDKTLVDA